MSVPISEEVFNQHLDAHSETCGPHFPFVAFTCPCDRTYVIGCGRCLSRIFIEGRGPKPCVHHRGILNGKMIDQENWVIRQRGVLA